MTNTNAKSKIISSIILGWFLLFPIGIVCLSSRSPKYSSFTNTLFLCTPFTLMAVMLGITIWAIVSLRQYSKKNNKEEK